MPTTFLESGMLFSVALQAAKSITAPRLRGAQQPALTSIVFAVVSLEAWINEAVELARHKSESDPPEVSAFAEFMDDAERAHASLESKFILASWILSRKGVDRGVQPYQDFAQLLKLRNDLVHFRPNEVTELNETLEEIHKSLMNRFANKNILANDNVTYHRPWTYIIQTKAVAEWSCKTAAAMTADFVSNIPKKGNWGVQMRLQQRAFQVTE